jgi:hypothetical protein
VGAIIPIFPLGHVLLPGMPLPLHIFEPRYRQLLRDVSADAGGASFGVVCLTRGSEVGTDGVEDEPQYAEVGTVAEVMEVQPYDDGASDLLTVGSRRFRILDTVAGKPYLQAEVDFLDERDGDLPAGLQAAVCALQDEHERLIRELTGRRPGERPPTDPNQLSYHLAAGLPLVPHDRQALLEERTTTSRLLRILTLLRRETAYLRATRTIAVSPGVLQLYVRPN